MDTILKALGQQALVITGASSGIGLATARIAAAAGARVFLAARDGDALGRICAGIRGQGGEAEYLAIDVSSEDEVRQLAAKAAERFGGFETWVNDAGVGLTGQLKDIATEDHRRLFDINYWGIVYGSLAAASHYRERGAAGAIINLGSAASDVAAPFSAPYVATKFAIKAFTDALRIELMQEKLPVSVTLIKPAAIDTQFFDHGRSLVGGPMKAPPPRYRPGVVAGAILHAAQHPKRSIAVGSPAVIGGLVAWAFPGLTDRLLSRIDPSSMGDQTRPAPSPDNLRDVPEEGQERSGHYSARGFSVTTAAQLHPRATMVALAAAAATVGWLFHRSGGVRSEWPAKPPFGTSTDPEMGHDPA